MQQLKLGLGCLIVEVNIHFGNAVCFMLHCFIVIVSVSNVC